MVFETAKEGGGDKELWAGWAEKVLYPTTCTPPPTPYTLHPTTYTLHPILYILQPAPYTSHPTPYTLHPSPFTLHPSPYTLPSSPYPLHPTPYTLHPTPYTLKPTPCTCLCQLSTALPSTFPATPLSMYPQLCYLPVACKAVPPVPQVYSWSTYTNYLEPLMVFPGTTLHAKCRREWFLAVVSHNSKGFEGNTGADVLASLIVPFSFLQPFLRSVGFTTVDSNNDNDDNNTAISYYVK